MRGESQLVVPPFPTELNDNVRSAIERYTNPEFGVALARGARFLPIIQDIFTAAGVPRELAYVALVESEFRTKALSHASARGLWQFMPLTGERFGLQQDEWIDERADPYKATRAAAAYLKVLHRLFGDWNLALAAYNAGEGRILRATEEHDTTDFWELARLGAIPPETRNYVPRIHAAILIAGKPQRYGIRLPEIEEAAPDIVPVVEAVDLAAVAECSGADVEQILDLNPALRRWATPAGRRFDLRVPRGLSRLVSACVKALPGGALKLHRVRKGQNLTTLARLYGRRVSTLADANAIDESERLLAGTELIIPGTD
jgi:membrane-bound lytic murein transglycosylase D